PFDPEELRLAGALSAGGAAPPGVPKGSGRAQPGRGPGPPDGRLARVREERVKGLTPADRPVRRAAATNTILATGPGGVFHLFGGQSPSRPLRRPSHLVKECSMNRPPSVLLAWAMLALLAATAQAAPSKPTISWSPCCRDVCPCECGTLQVPLDYDHPTGATISIAVLRQPARDPAHRIGSLFLNPGGPGGSGFEFALYAGQVLYSSEIRNRFDIVGFDPRGIESSDPLRCFGNPRQWIPYFTPFPFPITADEQAAWETSDRYLDGQCDQRASRIIDHMSTAEVARDLDLLRQAVGDDQLTYAGYSYGS